MPPNCCKPCVAVAKATCEALAEPTSCRHLYGLTVRHNPKYKENGEEYSESEKRDIYNQLIGKFTAKGLNFSNIYYERKNGLHFHCRIHHKKKLYFKAWTFPDCHVLFKEIYEEAGWLSYCQKEEARREQQQKLQEYLFSDTE